MKATYAILFAAIASVCAARELQQATTGRVVFFDNPGYSGGGQAFEANVPGSGCGDCKDLNFVGFNSWESFTSNAGNTIILYDGHFCGGQNSGQIPAKQGVIRGSLEDSVDSFRLCA